MMIILHCQISGKYHVITSIYATLIVAFNPNITMYSTVMVYSMAH